VSIVVPSRNEAGNVDAAIARTPLLALYAARQAQPVLEVIESSPALRILDLWTANHQPGAKMPPNTPPAPLMGEMSVPAMPPKVSEMDAREGTDFIHLVLRDELSVHDLTFQTRVTFGDERRLDACRRHGREADRFELVHLPAPDEFH